MPTTVIEDKLAAWIAALPAVQSQAGGRVHPFGEIPQGTDWPFVSYFRVMGPRLRHLRGTSGVSHPTIQIGCHARSYGQAKRLADSVRVAMDAFGRGDMGGIIVQSMITGSDRDFGPNDEDLNPPHGDEVAQPCVSFDVTIWFEEG
jgi:hypothetical protein